MLFCRTVVRPKRIGWSHPNEALSHLLSSAGYNHPWTLMYLACYPCLDTDMKTEICQAVLNRLLCLAHLRYCCSTFFGQEMNVVFTWRVFLATTCRRILLSVDCMNTRLMTQRLQPSEAACLAQEHAKHCRIYVVRVTQIWSIHCLMFPFILSQENLFLPHPIAAS